MNSAIKLLQTIPQSPKRIGYPVSLFWLWIVCALLAATVIYLAKIDNYLPRAAIFMIFLSPSFVGHLLQAKVVQDYEINKAKEHFYRSYIYYLDNLLNAQQDESAARSKEILEFNKNAFLAARTNLSDILENPRSLASRLISPNSEG